MTQFALLHRRHGSPSPGGPDLRGLGPSDGFVRDVAEKISGDSSRCWLLENAEQLIDDVWKAQQQQVDIRVTEFVKLCMRLPEQQAELLCWSGRDFLNLPIARTIVDLEAELRRQTASQPADLFLHFAPVP